LTWWHVETKRDNEVGRLETIPAKIIIETPLPNPFSVISSPSHIRKIVPAVALTIMTVIVNGLISPKIFCDRSKESILKD